MLGLQHCTEIFVRLTKQLPPTYQHDIPNCSQMLFLAQYFKLIFHSFVLHLKIRSLQLVLAFYLEYHSSIKIYFGFYRFPSKNFLYLFSDSPVTGTVALQFRAAPQGLMPLTHSRVSPQHTN